MRDSFSETAFGDCADSVRLKGEKAELEKQIYFSNFNAVNRKWISVGKEVIASLGLKKMTSPNIGNLVAFYTIFNFFIYFLFTNGIREMNFHNGTLFSEDRGLS